MKRYGGFNKILLPLVGMSLLALLLFVKQGGMRYDIIASARGFVPDTVLNVAKPDLSKECIVLYNSHEAYSEDIYKNIGFVLSSMSVNFDAVDIALFRFPELNQYKTLILSFAEISNVQQSFPVIFSWVNQGGGGAPVRYIY